MTAIDEHLGRFADDNEIGFYFRVHFNEGVGGNAITPFFHVAEVVGCPAIKQAEVTRHGQAIDHAGGGAFFITSAASV